MSYLVANLPPVECYIKKEYLYDFEKGHGEFEPCYWVTVKSINLPPGVAWVTRISVIIPCLKMVKLD